MRTVRYLTRESTFAEQRFRSRLLERIGKIDNAAMLEEGEVYHHTESVLHRSGKLLNVKEWPSMYSNKLQTRCRVALLSSLL